jgi:peptidoglycan hydrolase-like protein with peptidoglycan-binding domain
MQVLRLRCMSTEAHALRRLMDFGSALDLFQTAHVQAVELGEHEHEARLRLSRARVHLHHLGDLRQGAELVGDRDDALADASPELRLDHLILRMWLHDRLKNASEVHRLAAAAGRLFPEITLFAASNRLELAIALLALTCIDKRTEALSLLHSSLLVFDSATVRLAQLRGLRYCRPVEEVPAEISDELTRLTRLPPANDKSHDRLTPPDRLRLQLAQIDLLRVIGDSDQAQAELVGLRAALRRARCPLQDRNVALMCDRLDLAPEDVLPPDWLSGFRATYARYPTLCGAALLDEATRQLGRASAVQARDLANESQKLLQHRGAVPSILDALLFRLQGNLARELGKAQEGSELEARAGQIFSELGHPAEAQTGESLLDARREAWSGQLAGTDGFGVRVDSPKQLTLLSWSLERPDVGSTPRPLTPPLRDLLSNLGGHPLGGSASLPLIEMLSADWLPLGLLLAEAILPPSLRSAVAARLSLGTAQEDEPLDLVLASANHLVHAVPWELTAVDETAPRPVVLEPRLHHMWRTKSNTLPQSRIAFAQRAMSTILERPLTADGRPGRATTKAVREAQRHLNIPATGRLDLPTWRAIRDHYRSFYVSAARQKGPVLLVQTEARFEIQAQRGHASLGTDLASLYVDHGFSVDVLDEPDPGQLLAMLGRKTYQVLHLAAPIAETRSSSELFLRLGAESTRLRSATVFSTSLLAKQLRAARPAAPLVIVDVPRPASVTESLRQLVLRNVFAAQLFAFASLPVVLATGLGEPDEQWMLSERLVLGLAERLEPGDLAQVLRRTEVLPGGLPPVPSLDAVLATACVALFARDPELHPWDLAHGEAP